MSGIVNKTGAVSGVIGTTVGSPPAAKVLQVLSTNMTAEASVSSTTGSGQPAHANIAGLYVTITPASSSNKIYLSAHVMVCSSQSGDNIYVKFNGGNTATAIADSASSRGRSVACDTDVVTDKGVMISIEYLDSPATTSAITYYVQLAGNNNSGTVYCNRSSADEDVAWRPRGSSTITAMEISA